MKVRIHKETYQELCSGAKEKDFYGALNDWFEEQLGFSLEIDWVADFGVVTGHCDCYCVPKGVISNLVVDQSVQGYLLSIIGNDLHLNEATGYYEGEIPE